VPVLADDPAGVLDLAWVVGELVDGVLEVRELVEDPDRDVDCDERGRDDRERPRRDVVLDREQAPLRLLDD
jgi:hypothetical protein